MRDTWCGQHDCYDCYNLVEFANHVNICLKHKIQIVPIAGVKCDYWRWEEDGPDDLYANNAMVRTQQENAADLSHKE